MAEIPRKWCFVTVTTVLSYNKSKHLKDTNTKCLIFNSMAPLTTIAKSLVTFRCVILCEGTASTADYAAERFDLMESSRN